MKTSRVAKRPMIVALLAVAGCAIPAFAQGGNEIGPIVITEIMYNPHDLDEGQEWVEIYNPSAASVNLAGWYLENENGQTSPFAAGTTLASHAVAVICPRRGGLLGTPTTRRSTYTNTQTAWNTAWGPGIQLIFIESFWNYPGDPIPVVDTLEGLDNTPNPITDFFQLRNASKKVVDRVTYADDHIDETPWPDSNDSGSIQLLREMTGSIADNNNGAAWKLSTPGDAMGSTKANTALPAFPGINSYGTPGRLPNAFIIDCNGNGINDAADIVHGVATDAYPYNGIPQSCEGDCNANATGDLTEILLNWRLDRNLNGALDSCEINAHGGVAGVGGSFDTNNNGVLDSFENKPNIVITEIMYDPAGVDDGREYVEVYNAGATAVNISGWKLKDLEGDPSSGAVPSGTILQPGEVAVLMAGDGPSVPADIVSQFRTSWNIPASTKVIGITSWQDRGQRATSIEEVLALLDALGEPVDVANYENPKYVSGRVWPGDDGRSSIYLLSTALNKAANDDGANWRRSTSHLDGAFDSVETSYITDIRHYGSCGSPGAVWTASPQTPSGEVIFDEIMYNPNSSSGLLPRTEWIELYNTTGSTIDLSGWYLSDEDGFTTPVPAGTTLEAGRVAILLPQADRATAEQAAAEFRLAWGNVCTVIALHGWSDQEALPNIGDLSNIPTIGHEVLVLRHADGTVVDIVNYDNDGTIWPVGPTAALPGLGASWSIYLLPGHYNAVDNDLGASWAAANIGFDQALLNTVTGTYNGIDIGSPGLLESVVTDPTCPVVTCPCVADFDGSGGTPDASDIDAFFTTWLLGDPLSDADCSGGTPDAGDIDAFFTEWLAGGC
jgi:hypothetical protein